MKLLLLIIVCCSLFTCSPYNTSQETYSVKANTSKIFLKKSEENLVSNFGFEELYGNENHKEIWRGDNNIFSIDNSILHSGNSSLKSSNFNDKIHKVYSQSVDLLPGSNYYFSARIKSKNISGEGSGASISIQWMDENGKWLGGKYPIGVKGTQDWTQIDSRVKIPKEAAAFEIVCYVGKGMTGQAWFDDIEIFHDPDQFIDQYLLSPIYRGIINSKLNTPIKLLLKSKELIKDKNKYDYSVIVQLKDSIQNIIKEKSSLFETKDNAEIKFQTYDLDSGIYSLNVTVFDDLKNIVQLNKYQIQKVSEDYDYSSYIDDNSRIILDNKPFFPIGIYLSGINENNLKTLSQSKVNCILPYASPNLEQLDLAKKYNLKVIYSLKDFFKESDFKPFPFTEDSDIEDHLIERVRKFRNHPSILAWYSFDELPWEFIPKLENNYNTIRQEDPNHPIWAVLYQVDDISEYFYSFDAIGSDPYPIGKFNKNIEMVSDYTKKTLKQVKHSRPVWQVIQLHNLANYNLNEYEKKNGRTPNYKEVRNMVWQSICEGAMGIFFYSFFDMHKNPDVPFKTQWNNLVTITDEISSFSEVLLSTVDSPKVKFQIHDKLGRSVKWLAKASGNIIYLFVVNTSNNKTKFKFNFSSRIKTMNEFQNNEIEMVNESDFIADVEGLGVRIYQIDLN